MTDLRYQQEYAPEPKPQGNGADAMIQELAATVHHNILKLADKDSFKIRMP